MVPCANRAMPLECLSSDDDNDYDYYDDFYD
jgi:hypothetical protein